MPPPLQQFGGDWTAEKLERLRKYLIAYQQALKNQPFTLCYIDAFAGAGVHLSGRTRQNKLVHLRGPADWLGRLVDVRILHAGAYALRGTAAA